MRRSSRRTGEKNTNTTSPIIEETVSTVSDSQATITVIDSSSTILRSPSRRETKGSITPNKPTPSTPSRSLLLLPKASPKHVSSSTLEQIAPSTSTRKRKRSLPEDDTNTNEEDNTTNILSTLNATPNIDISIDNTETLTNISSSKSSTNLPRSPLRNHTSPSHSLRSPNKSPNKYTLRSPSRLITSSAIAQNLFSPTKDPVKVDDSKPIGSTTKIGKSPRKGSSPLRVTQPTSIITAPPAKKSGSLGLAALAAVARTKSNSILSSFVQPTSTTDTPSTESSIPLTNTTLSALNATTDTSTTTTLNTQSSLPSQLDTNEYQRLMKAVRNTRIATPLLEAKKRLSISSTLGTSNTSSILKSNALNKALEEAATTTPLPTSPLPSPSEVSRYVTFPAINTDTHTLSWPSDHQLYTYLRFRSCIPYLWILPQCLITDVLYPSSLSSKFGIEGRITTHALPPMLYQSSEIFSEPTSVNYNVSTLDPTLLNITATNALLNCARYYAYPSSHWSNSILNVTSSVTERFYTKVIAELQLWERDYNARKSLEEKSRKLQSKNNNHHTTTTTNTATASSNQTRRTQPSQIPALKDHSIQDKEIAQKLEGLIKHTPKEVKDLSTLASDSTITKPSTSSVKISPSLSHKKSSSSSSSSKAPFTSPRRSIPVVFRTRTAEDIASAFRHNILGGNSAMKALSISTPVSTTTTPKGDQSTSNFINDSSSMKKSYAETVRSTKHEKSNNNKTSTPKETDIAMQLDNLPSINKDDNYESTNISKSDMDYPSLTPKSPNKKRKLSTTTTEAKESTISIPPTSHTESSPIAPAISSPTTKVEKLSSLRIPVFPSWLPGAVVNTSTTAISGTKSRNRSVTTSMTGVVMNNTIAAKVSKPKVTASLAAAVSNNTANRTESATNISAISSSSTKENSVIAGYSPFPDVPSTAYERIYPILNSLTKADKDGIATWLDRVRRFQEALASVWSLLSNSIIRSTEETNKHSNSINPLLSMNNHNGLPFFMLRFGPHERTGNVILIGKASYLLQLQNPSSTSTITNIQPDTIVAIIARSNLRLRLCLNLANVPYASPLDMDLPSFDHTFTTANVGIQESLGTLDAALTSTGGIGVPVAKEALGMMAITLGLDGAGRDLARAAATQDTNNNTNTNTKSVQGKRKTNTADNTLPEDVPSINNNEPKQDSNTDENNDIISFALPDDDDEMYDNTIDTILESTLGASTNNTSAHQLKRSRFGMSTDPNSQSELRGTADSATSLLVIQGAESVQLLIQLLIDAVQPGAQLGSSLASMVTYHAQNSNQDNKRASIIPPRALLPLGTIALLGSGNPNTFQTNNQNNSLDIPQIITLPYTLFRHASTCELDMTVKQVSEEIDTNTINKGRSRSSNINESSTTTVTDKTPVFEKRWDIEIRGPILPTVLPKLWGIITTMQMREYTLRQTKNEQREGNTSAKSSSSSSSFSSIALYGGKDPYYIPSGLVKLYSEVHYTTTKFIHRKIYEVLSNHYQELLQQSAPFVLSLQKSLSNKKISSPISPITSSSVIKFVPWNNLGTLETIATRASHVHPQHAISSFMVMETMKNHYLLSYTPDLLFLQKLIINIYPTNKIIIDIQKDIKDNKHGSSGKGTVDKTDRSFTDNTLIMSLTDMKFRIENNIDE